MIPASQSFHTEPEARPGHWCRRDHGARLWDGSGATKAPSGPWDGLLTTKEVWGRNWVP